MPGSKAVVAVFNKHRLDGYGVSQKGSTEPTHKTAPDLFRNASPGPSRPPLRYGCDSQRSAFKGHWAIYARAVCIPATRVPATARLGRVPHADTCDAHAGAQDHL
jgi:hypothetical protein